MQWEKLERSYQALEKLLRTLRPADRFNLFVVQQPGPIVPGCSDQCRSNQCSARPGFVRASKLRGGTDMQRALWTALQQCAASGDSTPISSC